MKVEAYLFFDGKCEEALEFYRGKLGAELVFKMRYSESPDAPPPGMIPPGSDNKIMHATMKIGDSLVMASDGDCRGQGSFQGISLSISADSETDARRIFDALADGGQVQMPMGRTFFSPAFGMVADRFGVSWMVIYAPADAQQHG